MGFGSVGSFFVEAMTWESSNWVFVSGVSYYDTMVFSWVDESEELGRLPDSATGQRPEGDGVWARSSLNYYVLVETNHRHFIP